LDISFASLYNYRKLQYDLLIIFPFTEGPYKSPFKNDKDKVDNDTFIEWSYIKESWEKAIPGTAQDKKSGVDKLIQYWRKRAGKSPDGLSVRKNAWLSIAREAILDELASKGLQLKITAHKKNIYCRVRAPIRLLEIQADKDNYPLQLRGEIDPGSEEFWNLERNKNECPEIEEEKIMYSLEEAQNILEKLYRAKKISAADININTKEETEEKWSIRIHALERIADKVPVYNKFIPYATIMSSTPHLRYLFQVYPSVRGLTLFKSKDRLRLTKSLIESSFDMDIMEEKQIINGFIALHDANRGEELNVNHLAEKWCTFWRATSTEVGAPTVTHSAYEEDEELWFYERPFAQPLAKIRDYFGEKVAMYYAWLGHFTYFLLIPALLGAGIEAWYNVRGSQVLYDSLDWATYGYWFMMLTWSVIYIQSWKRECYAVAIKWGTRGFEAEEKSRPQFQGTEVRSPINNDKEMDFPEETRSWRQFGSWIVIVIVTLSSLSVLLAVYYLEYYLDISFPILRTSWYFTFAISILLAMMMTFNSFWFLYVAKWFNDAENYRTDTDYEDHLVIKMIFFEIFNSFGAASFEAFAKGYLFGTCYIDCLVDLRTLLYAIILVRILKSSSLMIITTIQGYLWFLKLKSKDDVKDNVSAASSQNSVSAGEHDSLVVGVVEEEDQHFLSEVELENYPSTFVDSAGVFTQIAFINLFSIIVPILACASLVENLLKIRVDAYKLCRLCRRPHAVLAEDAGFWSETMEFSIFAGIYMNVALICFAFPGTDPYSFDMKVILYLAVCQGLVLYVLFIQYLIPEEPEYIQDIVARHEFVIDKYVKGYEDKNESAEELGIFTDQKGAIDDRIDVDALNLYDLKKLLKLKESDYEEIEQKENERRLYMQELKILRDRLQEVYKTEIFNDATGVGETRHGLSLGRLSVKLVRIENFDTNRISRINFPFKIRVEIRGTKIGTAPIQKLPPSLTDSRQFSMPEDGNVVINQSLGPYAPIKTIDAQVFFHILFDDKDRPNEAPQATVSIKLNALRDQRSHDEILKWEIRDAMAKLHSTEGKLYVNLIFQYSKVVPIREEIYRIQDKLKKIEQDLINLKSGRANKDKV
jgi:hypothetical protein